jgi:hypothetical protein
VHQVQCKGVPPSFAIECSNYLDWVGIKNFRAVGLRNVLSAAVQKPWMTVRKPVFWLPPYHYHCLRVGPGNTHALCPAPIRTGTAIALGKRLVVLFPVAVSSSELEHAAKKFKSHQPVVSDDELGNFETAVTAKLCSTTLAIQFSWKMAEVRWCN